MPYGDPARVLGTIAVVVQHVCDVAFFDMKKTPETEWWIVNFLDASCRWAVPVYIMLSGALLLDPARREPAGVFYKKRLARLGIPIVFWSVVYSLLAVYYTGWSTPEQAWRDLALGKPYIHLHFVFRIAGLYAFTPMLRVFLAHASHKMVVQVVAILLGFSVANTFTEAFVGSELTAFVRFFPFLGFYLLGYLLREHRVSRRAAVACLLLFLACVAFLAGGTGFLIRAFGFRPFPSPAMLLYDFTSPVRIVMGVCAWLILVRIFDERWLDSRLGRVTRKHIAPATLGIYLIHLVFREVLHVNGIAATSFPLWIGIPVVSLAVYAASVASTLAIMRLPLVRKIVA